jgi:hypothetical protein
MGLIKEPMDVDFYVNTRQLTTEDEKAIKDYIKAYKQQHKMATKTKQKSTTKDKNVASV